MGFFASYNLMSLFREGFGPEAHTFNVGFSQSDHCAHITVFRCGNRIIKIVLQFSGHVRFFSVSCPRNSADFAYAACHIANIRERLRLKKLTWDPAAERFTGANADAANRLLEVPHNNGWKFS